MTLRIRYTREIYSVEIDNITDAVGKTAVERIIDTNNSRVSARMV